MRYYLYSIPDIEKICGEETTPSIKVITDWLGLLSSITVIAKLHSNNLISFSYKSFFFKYIDILKYLNESEPDVHPHVTVEERQKELIEFFIRNENRVKKNGEIGNNFAIINSKGQVWDPMDFLKFVKEWNLIHSEIKKKKSNHFGLEVSLVSNVPRGFSYSKNSER